MNKKFINNSSSDTFYSEILDAIHDCILLVDLNSNLIVYANKACELSYGYNQEEFIGVPISELDINETSKVYKHIEKIIKRFPKEHRFLTINSRKDGSKFPVEVISKLVEINGRRYLLFHVTDITSNTELQTRVNNLIRHLSNKAYRDYLTGAFNRAYLYDVWLPRLKGFQIGILLIDVDRFTAINEEYGHEGGDLVLEMIVKIASSCLRNKGKIVRYNGGQFAIVLREVEALELTSIAQKINEVIAGTPIIFQKGKVACSVTIGTAKGYIVENKDLEKLIGSANADLIRNKSLSTKK